MTPDDPRHGEYAGYQQHLRDGERPADVCPPCHEAMRRYQRVRPHLHALGRPPLVPIGEHVWATLKELRDAGLTDSQMERATGSAASCLKKYVDHGPTYKVRRHVKARLERVDTAAAIRNRLTHVGTIRRAQALGRIGYSAAKIAKVAGMSPDPVALLQRGEARFSSDQTRRKIATAYDRLHMKPLDGTHDRHVSKTINRATAAGWLPPFVWDSIDHDERPQVGADPRWRAKDDVDHAVVERVINGERLPMTRAERVEVVRRLRDIRGWSEERIEAHTGITQACNRTRYPRPDEEDAA